MTMKKLLVCSMIAGAFTLLAAELKAPAFQMTETELLAVLKENGVNDQVTACQELCHKGTASAVPALAALLTDQSAKELFHAARYGLQNIPGPEAEAALKSALVHVKEARRRRGLEASLRLRATPVPPDYAGSSEILTAFPAKTPLQNGDLSVVPALVEKALGMGFEAQLARRQLVGFPNDGIVRKMMELVTGPDVRKARLAVTVLRDRRVHSLLPQFCEIARTTKEIGVRNEIFKSFATLCEVEDLPLILEILKTMPREERLVSSLIRLATREFVADKVDVKILKAEYGYFGPDEVKDNQGRIIAHPVADVMDMVTELVKNGSRSIMAGNRLAGHGGFARDPAPGKVKELHLSYQIGDGPTMTTVTRENGEAELAGCLLPDAAAKPLLAACATAEGDYRAALVKVIDTLERRGRIPDADAVLFRPIFNGRDLTGWSQQDGYFSVKDGVITGESTKEHLCRPNHHLVYTAELLTDFELRAEFWLSRSANSGIQLRCLPQFIGDNGYQADMNGGGNYVGYLYHPKQHLVGERGADVTITADGKKQVVRFADNKDLQKLYRVEQWNDIRIVVKGRTINVWINGVRTTSIDDPREAFFPSKGHLALQLHQGPEMTVKFRNLRLRK